MTAAGGLIPCVRVERHVSRQLLGDDRAAAADTIRRNHYSRSVGNSAAGERAAEWTMENLREIRDEMRELVTPNV